MSLRNKVAVVYGAAGSIGGPVARALASEGAKVFLAGRLLAPVESVAKGIVDAGGTAEAAQVDALDEQALATHLQAVIDRMGRVDIALDAIGIPQEEQQGISLTDLTTEDFTLPIMTHARSYFLIARQAARRMLPKESGVIMTVTSILSRTGVPMVGGYGAAMAAKEALTRSLSAELAPHGIRVVGLRVHGMPETRTIKEGYKPRAKALGLTWEQWREMLANKTHPRRLMRLEEAVRMALFLGSDEASGITGSTINLTMGTLDD